MATRQREESGPPDVPAWILTYSDVITLLMTFFVLLLTFATDQVERFERMRISLLGGNLGTGIVSNRTASLDYDEIIWRERPRTARSSQRGSNMPPRYIDPALIAVGKGLKSLNEPDRQPFRKSHVLALPRDLLLDERGRITPAGARLLHAIAIRMRPLPYLLRIQAPTPAHINDAVTVVSYLAEVEGVTPAKLAVGVKLAHSDPTKLWIVLDRAAQ